MARVGAKQWRRAIDPVHPRRTLSADEIARLLDAVEKRPLLELQTIRIGPDAGKRTAKVKPRTRAKAIRKVRELQTVYLLAV